MKISILICSFGDDHWRRLAVERALPSAQAQTETFEIRAWHQTGGTLAEVRNAAAREALGSHLLFLDADDELAGGFVAAVREIASQRAQGGSALLFPSVQYVEGGREQKPRSLNTGRPLVEINRAVIGSVVPRDLFLELGGFGEEPIYEDWALWLKVSQHVPLIEVPEAVYRVHRSRESRNYSRIFMDEWYWKIRREHEARA